MLNLGTELGTKGIGDGWPTDRTQGDDRESGQVQRREQPLSGGFAFRLTEMGSALHVARPIQGNGAGKRVERAAVEGSGKGGGGCAGVGGRTKPYRERKRTGGIPTFGEMADEVVAALSRVSNQKHCAQWTSTLATYAAPLRNMPVDTISTDDVLSVLKPIWTEKPETASRVRGRIEKVLDAAKAKGFRAGENPARWRGHLDHLLPRPSKLTRGHHAAMPYEEVPAFVASLRERDALAAVALELCILTATRSGELLGMRWDEIDLQNAVWNLPAGRMKAGRPHRVPLSTRAVAILRKLEKSKRDEFVFAGHAPSRPLWHMAMNMMLRRMGVDVTVTVFDPASAIGRGTKLHSRERSRDRPGPHHRRQGRAGVPPQRRAGKAPQADGGMGVRLFAPRKAVAVPSASVRGLQTTTARLAAPRRNDSCSSMPDVLDMRGLDHSWVPLSFCDWLGFLLVTGRSSLDLPFDGSTRKLAVAIAIAKASGTKVNTIRDGWTALHDGGVDGKIRFQGTPYRRRIRDGAPVEDCRRAAGYRRAKTGW